MADYPDFVTSTGYGTGAGLMGWNCRHNFYPFYEGISERAYTDDELNELQTRTVKYNGEDYTDFAASQMQRSMERNIRQTKRMLIATDEAIKATDDETLRASLRDDFSRQSVRLKQQEAKLDDFLAQTGRAEEIARVQVQGFGKSQARRATADAQKHYDLWRKSIGAEDTPKTLAKYYDMKYNNTKEYRLLRGYADAVKKGDVSPLVGFDVYKLTAAEIEKELVGMVAEDGLKVAGYSVHFVDRVIGQTAEPHIGMRKGVTVLDVKKTLIKPENISGVRVDNAGRKSIKYTGIDNEVTVNPDTRELIQTNPI